MCVDIDQRGQAGWEVNWPIYVQYTASRCRRRVVGIYELSLFMDMWNVAIVYT